MFNSTTLKAIANARAHAARRDLLTYSDLPGPSMLTSANKSNHLRFLTSNPNDHAILSAGDPMMRFVVIDPQDKLTLVHSTAELVQSYVGHWETNGLSSIGAGLKNS